MQYGLNMTRFSFRMHLHARFRTSRHAHNSLQMYACMSGMHTPNLDYACMQIVSQGQRKKLYEHNYILRCNPLMIHDVNPARELLTVKLSPVPIIIGNSRISFNVKN